MRGLWSYGRHAGYGLIFACLLGCGSASPARSPHTDAAPRELSRGDVPVRILEWRVEYRYESDGNWIETFSQRYELRSREGVENWASSGTSFSPWYMDRPSIEATVLDPDGTERKLDPRTIAESSLYPNDRDIYSDGRLLRAPLPGARVGSIIAEKIVRRTRKPFFAAGSGEEIPLQVNVPREKVEVVIDLPESMPLHAEVLDAQVKREERVQNGRRRVLFKGGPYPAIQGMDSYAPPELAAWPAVAFSTAASWQEVAAQYGKLLEARVDPDAVATLARRAVREGDRRELKVQKLLDEVRKRVRYAAIEFGQAAIVPFAPKQVLERAYGDCKDQATLLVSLLRALDIEAHVALLRTGLGPDVRPGLPSLDRFDHAIVFVPGDQPQWIDPTAPYARAGELPVMDQGRFALVIDDDTTALSKTPVAPSSENTYSEVREVRLQAFGAANVKERTSATGVPEQSLRSWFSDSTTDNEKTLSEYVQKEYGAQKLTRAKVGAAEDLSVRYGVEVEASGTTIGDTELFEAWVIPSYQEVFHFLPEVVWNEAPRKVDFLLPFAHRSELAYRVTPPSGFTLSKAPAYKEVDLGPARLTRAISKHADGSVEARFAFHIDKQRLSPSELDQLRRGLKQLDREQAELLEFQPVGQQQIEARRVADGLRTFRAEIAKYPHDHLAKLRLAETLADVGFNEIARTEARAALALAPNDAVVHRTLGMLLARDVFGRWLGRGYDRDGALDSFRHAVQLNPKDTYSNLQIGVLLDHDASGRQYGDRGSTARAARHYDGIPLEEVAAYDSGSYLNNVLFSLLYSGQFAEVHRRLREREPEQVPAELALAAAAMALGPLGALDEAQRLGLRAEDLSKALAGAAHLLCAMGHYQQASALMASASNESADSALYSNRARLLHSLRHVEAAQLPATSPESVVKKALTVAALHERPDAKVFGDLISPRALVAGVGPTIELGAFSFALSGGDLPRPVVADVVAATLKATVSGNDHTGFRVRASLDVPGAASLPTDVFIVKEGSGYQVRVVGRNSRELGCEAAHLLTQNKDKAARQWLTWADEGTISPSGDDPLRVSPFARIWAKGAGDPQLAAAVLCLRPDSSAAAIALLSKARGKPAFATTALDHALAQAARSAGKHELMLEAATRLEKAHPQSDTARSLKLLALSELDRLDELEATMRRGLTHHREPGAARAELLRQLAGVQVRRGDVKASRQTLLQVVKEGHLTSSVYNDLAWHGLFVGAKVEESLDYALQAAQMSSFKDHYTLHTLASVYLHAGKTEEARQTLSRLLDTRWNGEPQEEDWYVIGGIAEAYGLNEAARSAYEKLKAPARKAPTATYHLAQKRLFALTRGMPK